MKSLLLQQTSSQYLLRILLAAVTIVGVPVGANASGSATEPDPGQGPLHDHCLELDAKMDELKAEKRLAQGDVDYMWNGLELMERDTLFGAEWTPQDILYYYDGYIKAVTLLTVSSMHYEVVRMDYVLDGCTFALHPVDDVASEPEPTNDEDGDDIIPEDPAPKDPEPDLDNPTLPEHGESEPEVQETGDF